MAKTTTAEQAVREYLMFLEDPATLVDQRRVAKLQAEIDSATDPVERLLAIAEYERSRHPNGEDYRGAFVVHAKEWADAHQVPRAAFESLGVPPEVLSEAGLSAPAVKSNESGHRRNVTIAEAQTAALSLDGEFTSANVSAAAGGGSPMTVRKALNALVTEGKIARIGPARNWTTPGRAPTVYRRT